MKEKYIEQKLVKAVKTAGGIALKFTSPSCVGVPDRLLLFPGGRVAFAEVKKYGMKPRPLQLQRHGMLRKLGYKVFVIDEEEQIQPMLKEMMGGGSNEGGFTPIPETFR